MPSYHYRDSYNKAKTVWWLSHFYNGNPCTRKYVFLYWNGFQVCVFLECWCQRYTLYQHSLMLYTAKSILTFLWGIHQFLNIYHDNNEKILNQTQSARVFNMRVKHLAWYGCNHPLYAYKLITLKQTLCYFHVVHQVEWLVWTEIVVLDTFDGNKGEDMSFNSGWILTIKILNGPLARYVTLRVANARECRERFPHHRGWAIPKCITARAWRTCRDACRVH